MPTTSPRRRRRAGCRGPNLERRAARRRRRRSMQVVVALAEQREVVVGEPVQEGEVLGQVVGPDRRRAAGCSWLDGVDDRLAHRLPVLDRGAHVAEGCAAARRAVRPDAPGRCGGRPRHGSAIRAGHPASSRRRAMPTIRWPASRCTRITGCMIRCIVSPWRFTSIVIESTRNGMSSLTISITVCVDCQPCLLQPRVVHAQLRRAAREDAREMPVRQRRAVQVGQRAFQQVFGRDLAVVLARELGRLLGLVGGQPVADAIRQLRHQLLGAGAGSVQIGRRERLIHTVSFVVTSPRAATGCESVSILCWPRSNETEQRAPSRRLRRLSFRDRCCSSTALRAAARGSAPPHRRCRSRASPHR